MNFDWIGNPLAIYGALAIGGSAALHLVVSTRIEMRRQQKRLVGESESLREVVATLEGKLLQLSTKEKQGGPRPAAYTPTPGLDVHKRAEALRMYRQGNDRQTVSKALGLKQAEVALLETVHHLLNSGVA